jgi:ferric-dicitrate binding protein FerR (iron transport regulator)
MDYKDYQVEDFLSDDFFVAWIKQPDAASDHFWQKWLEKHPEKAHIVAEAKWTIQSVKYRNQFVPTELEYLEVLEKVHQQRRSRLHQLSQKRQWNQFFRYAASLALLLACGFGFYYAGKSYLSWFTESPQQVAVSAEMVLKEVPYGQKLQITFPDGSSAKINAGSRLWYTAGFTGGTRTVHLEGEAYFEVVKDSLRPFRVITESVLTEVLGTAFNVRAYNAEKGVRVVVAEGKVKSGSIAQNDAQVIYPGEMAVFRAGHSGKKMPAVLKKELAWKNNILYFEKATIEEVLDELEKWYGVKIIVDPEISLSGRISGQFHNMALRNVLEGLGFSSKINYHFSKDTVWLYPKK